MNAAKTPFTSLQCAISALNEKLNDACQSEIVEIGSVGFDEAETALASLVLTGKLFNDDALNELKSEIEQTKTLFENLCIATEVLKYASEAAVSDSGDEDSEDDDYAEQVCREREEERDNASHYMIEAISSIEQILDQMEYEIEGA